MTIQGDENFQPYLYVTFRTHFVRKRTSYCRKLPTPSDSVFLHTRKIQMGLELPSSSSPVLLPSFSLRLLSSPVLSSFLLTYPSPRDCGTGTHCPSVIRPMDVVPLWGPITNESREEQGSIQVDEVADYHFLFWYRISIDTWTVDRVMD